MKEVITIILLVTGAVFVFLSALGLFRMPDLYTRLSTTTKGNTLGIGSFLLAFVILFMNHEGVPAKSLIALIFILITIPVSGHYLGRVAYFIGIKKSKTMKKDELASKFGKDKHKHEVEE